MKTTSAAALALVVAIAADARATTTTVVDIPAADGGTQRFLHVRPDAPIAYVVQFPGGDGILGIQDNGSMNTMTGQCNPIGRNREAFANRQIGLALIDQTTQGSIYNFENLLKVVRHVRERDNVPVWITGGSASTGSVGLAGTLLPAEIPGGVFFYSPARPASNISSIRRPAIVVYHPSDPDQFSTLMFNALTSAAVRERMAVTGGTNAGCGFHLFNGADAEFVNEAAGLIERNNAATSSQPNFQGLWWAGEAESGWGVNIAHQGDVIFMTWFTYDTDGSSMWLVASDMRKTTSNSFTGTLRRTSGPPFSTAPYPASQVQQASVGSATFTFVDAASGRFDYTVNGVTQSKNISRLVFDPARVPVCTSGGTGTPNLQDLWIPPDPSEQAWGVNVVHQGDILFATWFTYEADNRGQWYVMSGLTRQSDGRYTGGVQRTTGPAFSSQPFNAALVNRIDVGTATFDFSASPATFTYTVGAVTQTRAIQRFVFQSPPTVCR